MSKQLADIQKDFLLMTPEEQLALVQRVRHNKYTVRPALKKRKSKAAKSARKPAANKLAALLKSLPEDQREALLAQLTGKDNG